MNSVALNQNLNKENLNLPDKGARAALPYDEKMKLIDEERILYPKLTQLLQKVNECHQSTKYFSRPLCMRISGQSGSGKTTVYDLHLRKHPIRETEYGTEKPVLYSRIPCPARIGSLASQLLYDLGDPLWQNREKNINTQKLRLYNLLKACKVEIIFLDEVQHLVDRNSEILIRDSSDWFKELIDSTRIPIVFLGMPDSNKIFIENEQLANRVRMVESTSPFHYDDIFKKVLFLFDASLPLKDFSDLSDPELSYRIYIATRGFIKHISDLINESAIIAIDNRTSRITMPMLAQAYDKILFNGLDKNPFSPGFKLK